MKDPDGVAALLDYKLYHQHWSWEGPEGETCGIPEAELKASSVYLRVGNTNKRKHVLLHKRRVNESQAMGEERACVCQDCYGAFWKRPPQMCKYALANHMWLGRWPVLFRDASLAHQMLLALARVVTTKVVLRPESKSKTKGDANDTSSWDFLFHQKGMIGTAILFGNASCKEALGHFPHKDLQDTFAVAFVGPLPPAESSVEQQDQQPADNFNATDGLDEDAQARERDVRRRVSRIARLQIHKEEFDEQAAVLQRTNRVYAEATYDGDLVASWCSGSSAGVVPPPILDSAVSVPIDEEGPGLVVAEGPADATAVGQVERDDADVEGLKQQRYISAFDPHSIPGDSSNEQSAQITALVHQLQQLDHLSQRSVAAEAEAALESGVLLPENEDEAGRQRILDICNDVRARARRLSREENQRKLESELQRAAIGEPVPQLDVHRGTRPFSLWDPCAWTQARPTLWPYGDAANGDPKRNAKPYEVLTTQEWPAC